MDASSIADPELPVQRQLDAYNARDIEGFMAWWAEDCQYYEFPDRLLAHGAAEIRERHIARFKEPKLHGQLIKRIVVANVVVDQETVTRSFPDGPGEVDVVAIYEVEDGRIAKAWFKMGHPRLHPTAAFLLRPATVDDAEAIRSLTREAYFKWVPVIGREPLPMIADYNEAVRKHRIDLLYLDGKLAALIEMVLEDGQLLIKNVAVSPAFQNKGLGRKLLAHAEQVAAAQGCPVVRLYTNKLFVANVQLYSKVGYGVDREEESGIGITVYMSKPVLYEQASPGRRMTHRMALRGSCLCQAVRYEVDQLDTPMAHCHCGTCRKAHASAFATTAGVTREHFRWTTGGDRLRAFESSPGKLRWFCSGCATHLIAERLTQAHIILRVPTLDDDPGSRPAMHVWTSHDAGWLLDPEDVSRYSGWQPGR